MLDDIFFGLLKGIAGVALAVFGWFVKVHHDEIKEMKNTSRATELDLASYKTYVEKNFESKPNIQASLARVHEAIDKVNDKIDNNMEEIRGDIKQLLQRMPHA